MGATTGVLLYPLAYAFEKEEHVQIAFVLGTGFSLEILLCAILQ